MVKVRSSTFFRPEKVAFFFTPSFCISSKPAMRPMKYELFCELLTLPA